MKGFHELRMEIRRAACSRGVPALAILSALATSVLAQSPIAFQYIYDDLNQLVKVIDSTGVMIQYVYDPVGNMTQVIRSTIAPGTLIIFNVTPLSVAAGLTITIQGQGFSTTPSANTVMLNGTALTVVSATSTTLVVQIPLNAAGGTISVTVGGVTVTSSSPETILPLPNVLSLSPKATLAGTPFTLTVTGTNLTGATFAFSPLLTITSTTINPAGTSATLMVSPAASALGYYTLVATNAIGPSTATPQVGFLPTAAAFNTISIPGSNPNADPDTDGLTNAQELMLGTDPLNPDTDGDHYVDGIEVLYGSDPLNPLSIPVIPPSAPYAPGGVFSIENQVSPFPTTPQTYAANGFPFSMLNSASPFPTTPQTYVANGFPFSMLNSASPFPTTPQTYVAGGLAFSIFNGTTSSMFNSTVVASGPSLNFLVPVDPAFIAEALARGAQRINGKPVCVDTDGDGICDVDELIIGTNPYLADTDGDGYPDGLELALGSDPLNPKSVPDTRPQGYFATRPASIQNKIPIGVLTPRRQGAIDAKNR